MVILIGQLQRFYLIIAIIAIVSALLFFLSCIYIVRKDQCLVLHGKEPKILGKGIYIFFPFGKIHPKKYNKKPFKISAKSKYLLQIENFLLFDQSKKEFKQIIKTTPIEEVDLSKFGLKIIQQ